MSLAVLLLRYSVADQWWGSRWAGTSASGVPQVQQLRTTGVAGGRASLLRSATTPLRTERRGAHSLTVLYANSFPALPCRGENLSLEYTVRRRLPNGHGDPATACLRRRHLLEDIRLSLQQLLDRKHEATFTTRPA